MKNVIIFIFINILNMRFFILVLSIYLCITTVFAYSTEASGYAEKQHELLNKCHANINVKKEHTEKSLQKIGEQTVWTITYGWGDLKIKGHKTRRITYIVLKDNKCKPICSFIIQDY